MKEQIIYSLGTPPAFTRDTSHEMYWTERVNYELSKMFSLLNTEGFNLIQPEQDDFDAVEESYDTFAADVGTWLDSLGEEPPEGGDLPALPSIPDLTALVAIFTGNPWIIFLVKTGIQILLYYIRKQREGGTDVSELTEILRQGLIMDLPGGAEGAILEQLKRVPLHIVISKKDEYQDIYYTSQPEEE
jgi:hypothetical protein